MGSTPQWLEWLRKREIDQLFADHDLQSEQRDILERLVRSKRIVTNREADPSVDWFRTPYPVAARASRRTWVARAEEIDWNIFGICTPASGRSGIFNYDPTPIEASAQLLAAALAEASGGKRGPKPLQREAAKRAMRADIAAEKYTLNDLRDMKQEALARQYNVGRGTAQNALSELLSEMPTNSDP